MAPETFVRRKAARARAMLVAAAIIIALPASSLGASGYNTAKPSYVATSGLIAGVQFVPLVNSGEEIFGDVFEGIPDGIGVKPGPGNQGYVDLYVTHEQSHVPFGGFADFEDSSISRVRVDLASKSITDLEVVLPASAGFIRFCSAFMAGPAHGFPHYTFLANEESNDPLPVPAGAPYGPDPSLTPNRQAGYAVFLDTVTGKYDVIAGAGRHNHENTVIVPGGWDGIVSLSGDDTFSAPSSQLYMYTAANWKHFQKDDGALWAFRVTATGPDPTDAVNPSDPFNNANDYLEIDLGDAWRGEFIPVPPDIARGTTGVSPQTALENWSNEQNVFQFVRVEDAHYDPDNPRVIYFADTGTDRLVESDMTGRLFRGPSGTGVASNGRIFKMVLNANDPQVVDEFSILADANDIGMRNPDNLDVGHNSIMVQEDPPDNAKIWMYSLATAAWTHVATVDQDGDPSTTDRGESSGIVDASALLGAGWWALDVQSHVNLPGAVSGNVWPGPGGPAVGSLYTTRREDGQLLLMQVPGS